MTIILLRAYFRNEPLHYNCNMQRFDRRWAGKVIENEVEWRVTGAQVYG
jgi:hypothetical protein